MRGYNKRLQTINGKMYRELHGQAVHANYFPDKDCLLKFAEFTDDELGILDDAVLFIRKHDSIFGDNNLCLYDVPPFHGTPLEAQMVLDMLEERGNTRNRLFRRPWRDALVYSIDDGWLNEQERQIVDTFPGGRDGVCNLLHDTFRSRLEMKKKLSGTKYKKYQEVLESRRLAIGLGLHPRVGVQSAFLRLEPCLVKNMIVLQADL